MPADPPTPEAQFTQLQCPACHARSAPPTMFCPCGHEFDPARDTIATATPFRPVRPPGITFLRRLLLAGGVIILTAVLCVIAAIIYLLSSGQRDLAFGAVNLVIIVLLLGLSSLLGLAACVVPFYFLPHLKSPPEP